MDRDPDLIPGDVRRCLERARGPVDDDVCTALLSHPCRCCRAGRAGRAQAYVRARLRLLRVATQRWTCTHAGVNLTFTVHQSQDGVDVADGAESNNREDPTDEVSP